MISTLLQTLSDTTKMITHTKTGTSVTSNYWMWIAASEFLVIGYLTYRLLNKRKIKFVQPNAEVMDEFKTSDVDMDLLMSSINNSRKLYKELSAKCHPDRFETNGEKRKIAEELFQEITKYQRNYEKLSQLSTVAIKQLNINL